MSDDFSLNAPPTEYDFEKEFAKCKQEVRDQARCGSCWAFGAAEAFEDRICRASSNTVRLSTQDMVSCEYDQYACDGGYLDRAWNYLAKTGIVTEECFPYSSFGGEVESCPSTCTGVGEFRKYKVKNNKQICSFLDKKTDCQNKIKEELANNGPLEVAFTVYQDFMSYKSGVYKHTSGSQLGGHAIKLVAYGVDPVDGPYWKC